MTIDTNPIADGNAAMANANAATTADTTANMLIPPTGTNLINGTGLPDGASTTQTPTRLVDDSGAFAEGWLDRLPPEFNDSKQILGQFKDPLGMAKTLVSQQRLLGKKAEAVVLPSDKSSPEEWTEFHRRMGVPESPDAYKAYKPSTLPDGTEWNDEVGGNLANKAHALGITPKQYQGMLDAVGELEAQSKVAEAQRYEQEHKANLQQLAKEWGDKFDINRAKVTRLVQSVGGDPNDPALSYPAMVKMLERIASTLSEDKLVTADLAATTMVGMARAMNIMKNPQDPLHQLYKSGDRATADFVNDLMSKG